MTEEEERRFLAALEARDRAAVTSRNWRGLAGILLLLLLLLLIFRRG